MSYSCKDKVKRVSISLPESVYHQLDSLVAARGFDSRSQAVAEMITQEVADYSARLGNEIMTGTITLVYEHRRTGLRQQLAEIEYNNIAEVITSLHVFLEDEHTMEVLLVQGPAEKLKCIADQLITCKGVKTGELSLSSNLIPPIHSKSK